MHFWIFFAHYGCSFGGGEDGDLSVHEGEQIEILETISNDWFRARSLDGLRTGIVPATYIQQLP